MGRADLESLRCAGHDTATLTSSLCFTNSCKQHGRCPQQFYVRLAFVLMLWVLFLLCFEDDVSIDLSISISNVGR